MNVDEKMTPKIPWWIVCGILSPEIVRSAGGRLRLFERSRTALLVGEKVRLHCVAQYSRVASVRFSLSMVETRFGPAATIVMSSAYEMQAIPLGSTSHRSDK